VRLLIKFTYIHELILDERVIVESIAKSGFTFITLFDFKLKKSRNVNIHQNVDLFLHVQLERKFVIEG